MSTNTSEKPATEKQSRKAFKKKNWFQRQPKDVAEKPDKQTRKQQKRKQKEEKRKIKRPRRRVFPIWLRIIVVLILVAAAIIAGLMIGYGVIGDGVPIDALKKETWQHIIDIVTKVE